MRVKIAAASSRSKSIFAVLIATMVITVMPSAMTGTAHAADTAWNVQEIYLTDLPSSGMTKGEVQRRIYIPEGKTYGWFPYVMSRYGAPAHPRGGQCGGREIYLGAGWYTWKDELFPLDKYYAQLLSLDPDNPAWNTVYFQCDYEIRPADWYTWGSGLDPH